MPTDLTLDVRKAVVAHLRAWPALTALVPAERIHGEAPPVNEDWPFIRYGNPATGAFEASCWSGSEHALTLHCFAAGPGTDAAARIAKRVVAAMAEFEPATFSLAANEWQRTQIMLDEPATDNWHAVVDFNVVAVAG